MGMATTTAAKVVCDRSSWQVTHLALQKILYIAQMAYLGEVGARLINATFEAWDYGPVIPSLYHRVKVFGDKPIRDIFDGVGDADVREVKFLQDAADFFLPKSPGQLVALTHWERGAWAAHYQPGVKGIVIPDADIVREYRARTEANQAA